MSWKTVDTAPRDGTVIIGRFAQKDGQGLAEHAVLFAVWSEAEDCWAAAVINTGPEGESYFYTNHCPGTLSGWMPVPEPERLGEAGQPPKDKVFVGHFGYPWALAGHWSEEDERFVHADLQLNIYQGKHDPYFETESFGDPAPTRWMPLPCPVSGYAS